MEVDQSLYTTFKEKEFIDGLGTYRTNEQNGSLKKSRKELLQNYLLAAQERVNWGSINSIEIINYVVVQLRKRGKE